MYFKNNKHYFFLFLRNSRKKLYISEFVNNMLNILYWQFFLHIYKHISYNIIQNSNYMNSGSLNNILWKKNVSLFNKII